MNFLIILFFASFSVFAQQDAAVFSDSFLFGVATAPGHVEDKLSDTWLDFAHKGRIKAFHNQASPDRRLDFWTQPEIELDLAQKLGVTIYRLGVDWGRIQTGPDQFDEAAISRYKEIIRMVRDRKMKVMLTLFHFTVPKWIQAEGGWKNDQTITHFIKFSEKVMNEFHPQVDYWITFNEPQIFTTMAYTAGIFPPGDKAAFTSMLSMGPFEGETIKALKRMGSAHNQIYDWAHQKLNKPQIGISQHMGFHSGKSFLNKFISGFTGDFMNWFFPDLIKGKMDFFGFNYYGAEWIKGTGVDIDPDEEYSEAGRAIYPSGLLSTMKEIKKRYPTLPQFITENGISDATDWLRPSYLIEHLLAIQEAQQEQIPVLGYIFWTLSDNMEWSDGYCPKFGLVSVDRANNLKRELRPSFYLYQNIIKNKRISQKMREDSWNLVKSSVGKERPFCRASDGITGLDTPVMRKVIDKDWRFKN